MKTLFIFLITLVFANADLLCTCVENNATCITTLDCTNNTECLCTTIAPESTGSSDLSSSEIGGGSSSFFSDPVIELQVLPANAGSFAGMAIGLGAAMFVLIGFTVWYQFYLRGRAYARVNQ